MEHHAKYCVKSQFLNVVLEISIASIPKISNVDMINPNSEGVPATHLSEGGGADSAPPW